MSIATALAAAINNNATLHSQYTITSSGGVVSIVSIGTGAATNFTLTAGYTYDTGDFSHSSFTTAVSLTNGHDAQYTTVWDTGNVTLKINNFGFTEPYSQTSTTASIMNKLMSDFNNAGASSPVTITNLSTSPGGKTNYIQSHGQGNRSSHKLQYRCHRLDNFELIYRILV